MLKLIKILPDFNQPIPAAAICEALIGTFSILHLPSSILHVIMKVYFTAEKNEREGILMEDIKTRCCFTGHRPEKLNISEDKVRALLRSAIEAAAADNFTVFITGMARGIDIWAAEEVLELRRTSPSLSLICAVPYPSFRTARSKYETERYDRIISMADRTEVISPSRTFTCYQKRNIWMVDRSARVIAAFNGSAGGTKNTLDYAASKGVEVINILSEK